MLRLSGSPTQLRQPLMMKHLAEQKTSFNASRTGVTKSRDWCWRIRRFGSRVTLTERSSSNISQLVGVVSIE